MTGACDVYDPCHARQANLQTGEIEAFAKVHKQGSCVIKNSSKSIIIIIIFEEDILQLVLCY